MTMISEEDYKKENSRLLEQYAKLRNEKIADGQDLAYCDYIGEAIEDLDTGGQQSVAEDDVLRIVNEILETGGYARNFIISPKTSIPVIPLMKYQAQSIVVLWARVGHTDQVRSILRLGLPIMWYGRIQVMHSVLLACLIIK